MKKRTQGQKIARMLVISAVALVAALGQGAVPTAHAQSTGPTITDVTPNPASPGTQITITGTGFEFQNIVKFSAGGSVKFSQRRGSLGGTTIKLLTPTLPEGDYLLTVTTAEAQQTSNPVTFTIADGGGGGGGGGGSPGGPTITDVTPNPASPGTQITITGTGFEFQNIVKFSAGGSVKFSQRRGSLGGTAIKLLAPTLPEGDYLVTVTTDQAQQTSNPVTFTINNSGGGGGGGGGSGDGPVIDEVVPTSGAYNDSITINGSGFELFNYVTLKGSITSKFLRGSSDGKKITFTVPNIPAENYKLTVTARDSGKVSNEVDFAVTEGSGGGGGGGGDGDPQIASIEPDSAHVNTSVTITGANFDLINTVRLTGPETRDLLRGSFGKTITFTIPGDLKVGTYDVTVIRRIRSGTSNAVPLEVLGSVPALNHVATGDSIANGLIAVRGYVRRYRNYIEADTNRNVDLNNVAQNGQTSDQLLNQLQNDAQVRTAITQADFVTFNTGGNDLRAARSLYKQGNCGGLDNQDCLRNATLMLQTNWNAIVNEIAGLRGTETDVRTIDLYNPFVTTDKNDDSWPGDGGLNDFEAMKPYFDTINATFKTAAQSQNIPIAQVSVAFNGIAGTEDPNDKGFISLDRYHPNDSGHKKIADLLRALGPLN